MCALAGGTWRPPTHEPARDVVAFGVSSLTRVVLIGYGYAGRVFHAPLIRSTAGLELVAVGSSRAASVRADLPDVAVLPPDEAVSFPSADLVVIATPNDTHVRLATAAFAAGKHVIVEKPFAPTLDEARQLTRLATSTSCLLAVFQNRRWDADFLGVKDHVFARGLVGEVVHFESHYDRYRPDVRARWREQPGGGSGIWYDLGPHLVDQALQLFGLPDRVTASLAAQRVGAQTDDWAHVLLEYARLRVILNASMLAAGRIPRFIVHGQTGSWAKYGLDVQEAQLVSGLRPGDDGWGDDLVPAVLVDGRSGTESELRVPRGDYRQFYVHVRDALRGAGRNPVPPEQAVAVIAVLETAIRSWMEGRALPLPLDEGERREFSNLSA